MSTPADNTDNKKSPLRILANLLLAGAGQNRKPTMRDKFHQRKRELEQADLADERAERRELAG